MMETKYTDQEEQGLPEEQEWFMTTPAPKLKTSGVVCETCGVLLPKRRFIWNNVLLTDCPDCRKKRNNREAQRRFYERDKELADVASESVKRRVYKDEKQINSEINRRGAMDRYRLKKMHAIVESGRAVSKRTREGIAYRERHLAYLEFIRELALRDFRAGNQQPLAYYFNDPAVGHLFKESYDTGRKDQSQDQSDLDGVRA